jgi:peptidyl-prolyl cis-trans isomerase C
MPRTPAIKFRLLLPLTAVLCLSACTQHSGAPASSATTTEAQGPSPAVTDSSLNQQAGVADGARDEIELRRIELLVRDGATRAGVYATPSDAELKAQYDRFVSSLPPNEFHVAHILLPSERMAQALITELQSGAEFAKLAREESADDSNVNGGDIGWISSGRMPAAFIAAVQRLKPGQITPHPVHTIDGWHVIKVLDKRSSDAPQYDQVKAQLAVDIQQQRYEKFLAGALPKMATAPSNRHQ